MASPRVFVSSTCYDLADERDGLVEFCDTFGFDTTLSERGDIFFHPDLHTHEACVRETANCHLLVLIIGGRFGGKYKIDQSKSITNAEYSAAVEAGIPIFTFVKQDVLNDHNLWQKNKTKSFSKEIEYPSIDNQEHAIEIFKFIDTVRLAPQNNGIFGFKLTRDIFILLRKQLAGMFYDFLQARKFTKQIETTNTAVNELRLVSSKIEELVKGVYKHIDVEGAEKAIASIDKESLAESFLSTIAQKIDDLKFVLEGSYTNAKFVMPSNWWTFLQKVTILKTIDGKSADGSIYRAISDNSEKPILKFAGTLTKNEQNELNALDKAYEILCKLPAIVQYKLISKYMWTKADSDRVHIELTNRAKETDENETK